MGHILVVEDNLAVSCLINEVLTLSGYSVQLASNCTAALQLIQANPPCLVLLDLKLPSVYGIKVLNIIKHAVPDIPVIAMSAYAELLDIQAELETGRISYILIKPFNLHELINAVARYIPLKV